MNFDLNRILRQRLQAKRLTILTSIIFVAIIGSYLLIAKSTYHDSPIIRPLQSAHSTMTLKLISVQEVENHKDEKSAWVIVEGKVYDVTDFLEDHPGGKKILLKNCGKDATELFHQYHTKKILKNVAGPMIIGQVTSDAKLPKRPNDDAEKDETETLPIVEMDDTPAVEPTAGQNLCPKKD